MKKVISILGVMLAVIAAFFTLLTLGGCVTKVVTAPTTTETSTTTTTIPETTTTWSYQPVDTTPVTLSQYDLTNLYITYVRDNIAVSERFSDSELIQYGQNICNSYAGGMTNDEVLQMLFNLGTKYGFTNQEIIQLGGLAGAAVPVFCPEYTSVAG